jgi:hypothetical protein
MAMPCDLARTHLSDDLLLIEAIDESRRPVPPGERSAKILLTNLYNTTLPLIRYEITDEVTILDERCPCGSAFRLIGDIQGRLDDTFVYRSRTPGRCPACWATRARGPTPPPARSTCTRVMTSRGSPGSTRVTPRISDG